MPALLERPKLSSAMARALHRHVMVERERKRQEEEEVDKMMEQKMKEEQERRRKKEMEERMSLEETKEQILKLQEKLQALQEEKHQLFLQLKKVLHEEEKRRRKEQSDMTTLAAAAYQQGMAVHAGTHILNMQGSPSGHNRAATLIPADRAKQMFGPPVITVKTPTGVNKRRGACFYSKSGGRFGSQPALSYLTRHFATQPAFPAGTPEHGQYQGSQAGHSPYAVGQGQHTVPVSYASSQSIRGPSAFSTMQYLPQQQPGYAIHGHFPAAQAGFIPPSTTIPLQKQLEHANQQSGFSDSSTLRPMHPQALHPNQGLLQASQLPVQMQTTAKPTLAYTHPARPASPGTFPQQPHTSGFQASPQAAPRHPFIQHPQGQRFYHK
ncbi:G protein pathway suppressor 2 isoform X2 [Crotalus tigris]|uniref:G protein pathway suppressor 2 isoform X2 n=1 Tax=Crotalus tigris TaxID=88082 RepID=UPI00192F24C8|nr:G protein pathway suppressor 2 isoform X2 [Crotalus tigris]